MADARGTAYQIPGRPYFFRVFAVASPRGSPRKPALSAYHFEGFGPGKKAGAFFDPERFATYIEGAERLIGCVNFMVSTLDRVVAHHAGR